MAQDHHLITQQSQRPTRPTFRRSTTCRRDQMRFHAAVHLFFINAVAWLGLQHGVQTFLDKLLTHPFHRGPTATYGLTDLRIRHSRPTLGLVRQQQHSGSHQLSRRCLACRNHFLQILPFLDGERHPIALFHDTLLANWSSMNPGQECTIHQLTKDRALVSCSPMPTNRYASRRQRSPKAANATLSSRLTRRLALCGAQASFVWPVCCSASFGGVLSTQLPLSS